MLENARQDAADDQQPRADQMEALSMHLIEDKNQEIADLKREIAHMKRNTEDEAMTKVGVSFWYLHLPNN